MKLENGSIIFESRMEAERLEAVLREWLKDHPLADERKRKVAEEAAGRLETLGLSW